ncbi:tumor necrosis factor-like [Oryzias latipes]|uniref:Tumor necrosis factor n=1 Tax=Oryzias latipes TaxID=8090 RepID=H2MMX5_ORYLA|nr:tumor necrosis factor-like [Oryzias latipes]
MVEYSAAATDVEAGVEQKMAVLVEKKRSIGWMWKILVVLVLAALCLGGARLFVWYWSERPEIMSPTELPETPTAESSFHKTDPHHSLKQISSNSKAAIHLQGLEENSVLKWADDEGHAFSRGGLKLVNNEIIIPREGLYFVYSQASFRVSCGDSDTEGTSKNPTHLSHRIQRFSKSVGGKTSVMSALRSVCQTGAQVAGSAEHNWYNAIYLGGVFSLNQGDRLWTETRPLLELETDDGSTFFGVFAL